MDHGDYLQPQVAVIEAEVPRMVPSALTIFQEITEKGNSWFGHLPLGENDSIDGVQLTWNSGLDVVVLKSQLEAAISATTPDGWQVDRQPQRTDEENSLQIEAVSFTKGNNEYRKEIVTISRETDFVKSNPPEFIAYHIDSIKGIHQMSSIRIVFFPGSGEYRIAIKPTAISNVFGYSFDSVGTYIPEPANVTNSFTKDEILKHKRLHLQAIPAEYALMGYHHMLRILYSGLQQEIVSIQKS